MGVYSMVLCGRIAAPATAMTVPVVHEMHQRAREEQKIGQYPEDMRRVLGEQKKAGNDQEAAYCEAKRHSPPLRPGLSVHFVHLP
jgi:hypothetical protein